MNLSPSNEKIKLVKKLSLRHFREKNGLFLLEGRRAVEDAIENGADISFVLSSDAYKPGCDKLFDAWYTTDVKTFASLSQTESPQEILAVAKIPDTSIDDVLSTGKSLIVYCDCIQDPGNLGTIVRTADSAGAAGVLLSPGTVDLYNPKVVRSTMSSIFNIPIVQNAEVGDTFARLKSEGFKILSGALTSEAKDVYETDFTGRCVIVIGNEANGVSGEALALSDHVVKIPMVGGAESLNASVSAGILIYEHYRQNM